jgi:hypothetical protein
MSDVGRGGAALMPQMEIGLRVFGHCLSWTQFEVSARSQNGTRLHTIEEDIELPGVFDGREPLPDC